MSSRAGRPSPPCSWPCPRGARRPPASRTRTATRGGTRAPPYLEELLRRVRGPNWLAVVVVEDAVGRHGEDLGESRLGSSGVVAVDEVAPEVVQVDVELRVEAVVVRGDVRARRGSRARRSPGPDVLQGERELRVVGDAVEVVVGGVGRVGVAGEVDPVDAELHARDRAAGRAEDRLGVRPAVSDLDVAARRPGQDAFAWRRSAPARSSTRRARSRRYRVTSWRPARSTSPNTSRTSGSSKTLAARSSALGLGQLAGLERVGQRVVGRGREREGRGSSCAEARGARTSVDTARNAVRPSNLKDGAACRMCDLVNCSQQSATDRSGR